MPGHSVENSDHEEKSGPLEPIYLAGGDSYDGNIIKNDQLAFTSRNDNQDNVMSEPTTFDTYCSIGRDEPLAATRDGDTSDNNVSDSTPALTPNTTPPPTPGPSTLDITTETPTAYTAVYNYSYDIDSEYLDFTDSSDEEWSDAYEPLRNDNNPVVTLDMSVGNDDGYSSDDSWASDHDYIMDRCRLQYKFCFPTHRNLSTLISLEDKQSSPDCNHVTVATSNSRLESLPAELRIQILASMPDLGTLHSIIHASPVMYAQFSFNRNGILATCMGREFEGFFADAYANLRCRISEMRMNYECDRSYQYDKKRTTRFLNSYNNWLKAPDYSPNATSLSPKRIRWMIAYHMSIARPLVRRYSSWALENLRQAAGPKMDTTDDGEGNRLSRSEEIRIFRALYRYETYCHTFSFLSPTHVSFRYVGKSFFGLFDPWEVEAIGCMATFIEQQWNAFFDRVQDDMEPEAYEARNGYWNPGVEIELRTHRDKHVDCMISRGLETLVPETAGQRRRGPDAFSR
ncbi:hypothetical protein O1611_g8378 [Lasiodiplodia mahajangana]|uniref:Uncharacterized protein n=1 Tax=Lasiodiplodia mahajangana TaxID=1108764 RepID=A0ACC2JCV7_9PEZI|nr:hypothetical protein O1611_g8378 [Lasiodiplodia mahajangana]